jgi:hypothetical protein
MILSLLCTKGESGQLKASEWEFEITDTTSTTSTLCIKAFANEVAVFGEELRQLAVGLQR